MDGWERNLRGLAGPCSHHQGAPVCTLFLHHPQHTDSQETRLQTHRRKAICVPVLLLQDNSQSPSEGAYLHPHWGTAILLPLLLLQVVTQEHSQSPHPHPHRREAIRLCVLPIPCHPEIFSQYTPP